jgi:hypothetical protein
MLTEDDCICNMWMNENKIEIEISDRRIELRCNICKGIIRWWWDDDEPDRTMKIMPFKRPWSNEECLDLR